MKTRIKKLFVTAMLIGAVGFYASEAVAQSKTTLKTESVYAVTANQATCQFTVQSNEAIQERGVVWSNYPNPTTSTNKKTTSLTPKDRGYVTITGLKASTTYYVRAYAKSGPEIFYGNELSFTTPAQEQNKNTNQNTGQKVEPKQNNSK